MYIKQLSIFSLIWQGNLFPNRDIDFKWCMSADMVVHACNPSTLEAEREEDHKFKARMGYIVSSFLRKTKTMGKSIGVKGI
jgi:hypothetical protein